MSKTYFNAFNESEFYCITFRFYGHATGERRWGCGAACVCVKMHSTQNVDKLVKTLHEVGKTGDKAETNRSFSYRKKSHLKCQMWCVFLGLCPLRFPSLPTPALAKTTFPLAFCINSVSSAELETGGRRSAGSAGGCGSQMYARFLNFWAPFEFCGLLGFRLPLPNSFDQKLKLYFGAAPRGQRRQQPRGDGDMFRATATTTKAFSHKGPPIRGRHRRRTRRLSEHSMSAKCTCSSPRML